MTELTQKPGESVEHFVRRVVRKWQRQGGIKIEGGDPMMATYRWRMEIEVEAEDECKAQARIEEMLEEAYRDPDGPFSYGQLYLVTAEGKECRR